MMASDPDALWPKRTDLGSEGVDEDREVDDINLTLDEDLLPEEEEQDEWAIDADERPVNLEDEDRDEGGAE
ncbi:hypothetical protein [Cryobacterium tagatosivorans]|uniref:Uncharacterized protein n=1 Tax=Cryobacterium tagatosivorans TaxID=1259199 RepID=A0A4R8UIG9_9MICO|nr:hypothetical protein [Cryobacterium tagatosivorans]TFB53072.1 hypothetical protein E3O23_05720 [Cryobacterium tagatosivorans]